MNLTTKSRVKTLGSITGTKQDDIIDIMIPAISALVKKHLDREILIDTYIESVPINHSLIFSLSAYPILDIISTTLVSPDYEDEELNPDDFSILDNGKYGYVSYNNPMYCSRNSEIRFEINGGMAVDTEDFYTRYPDIELEIIQQILFTINRNKNIAEKSHTVADHTTTYLPNTLSDKLMSIIRIYSRGSDVF